MYQFVSQTINEKMKKICEPVFLIIFLLILLNEIGSSEQYFNYQDEQVIESILNGSEHSLTFDKYLDNDELDDLLSELHDSYPEVVKVYTIGQSALKRPLKVLAISESINDLKRTPLKPSIKLVANQYGNEAIGRQLLIYLVQFLLENYPRVRVIEDIVTRSEVHVLFTMDPDGYEQAVEGDCEINVTDRKGKFPDQYDSNPHILYEDNQNGLINLWLKEGIQMYNGKPNESEIRSLKSEVEAVEKWTLNNRFSLSLDLHSGLMAIFYPYSRLRQVKKSTPLSNYYLTPDNDLFEMFAFSYALNHPSMNTSDCNPLRSFGDHPYPVMNRAFFRPKIGSMLDYNYFFANCLEITVYLSCCAYPPKEELQKHWLENKVALVNHLRLVHMGIKGVIKDALTNEPLEGVFVHVHGNAHITISDSRGEYFRLLPAGAYKITFELSDYKNRTIPALVDNLLNQANPFNVKMQRILEELKSPEVLAAKEREANYNWNRTFTGIYKNIRMDFESVPAFRYHNYDDMVGYMLYYHEKYPTLSYIYKIGGVNSTQKRYPFAMVISTSPEDHELLKPEFKYSANSFATDWIGRELLLLLIKHLLESYNRNEEISALINTTRIHIIPSIDPESYETAYNAYTKHGHNVTEKLSKTEQACQTTETISNLDLIYPDSITEASPSKYKNDRVRFMNWLDEMSFTLSGSLYDGQILARIPFNTITFEENATRTQEDELFRYLAKPYVQSNKKMLKSKGCENDPCKNLYNLREKISNGIVNGAEWQRTNNTMQDYFYNYLASFDIGFFISCERMPDPSRLYNYWLENRDSLVNFIKQVHGGVKGILIDGESKQLIANTEISINIEGIKKRGIVYSKGDYFRLLTPGVYNMSISCDGYHPATTESILVIEGKVNVFDFRLFKLSNKTSNRSEAANELISKIQNVIQEKKKHNESKSKQNGTKKMSAHLVKYSTITLLFIASLILLVYYGNQAATHKSHLRRGFHQLFNRISDDDSSLAPLDSEMNSSTFEIAKHSNNNNANINQTEFTANTRCYNDEIVLLGKS